MTFHIFISKIQHYEVLTTKRSKRAEIDHVDMKRFENSTVTLLETVFEQQETFEQYIFLK